VHWFPLLAISFRGGHVTPPVVKKTPKKRQVHPEDGRNAREAGNQRLRNRPIYYRRSLSELPPGLRLSEKIALSKRTEKRQFRAVRFKNGRNTLATETQLASARHPLTASQQEWWQSGRYALGGCAGRLISGPVAQIQVMGPLRLTSPTRCCHSRRSVERRGIA